MLRPGLERLRIMGVLQRIGLCYLVVSLLFLYTTRKTQQFLLWALPVWYFAALWANGVSLDDKIWNLAAVVDRWALGDHLWSGARRMWDPEGLLSTLPAISTTLIGVWAGRILREDGTGEARTARLMVVGFLLLTVGYLWSWIMPINKALWTSSYVFFTGGMAMLGLGVCYWFADVKGHQGWTKPFVVYGVNAITVFVMSGLVAKSMGILRVGDMSLQRWVFLTFFDSWLPTIDASLLYSFVWVLAWYAVLYLMWRKNIILKV